MQQFVLSHLPLLSCRAELKELHARRAHTYSQQEQELLVKLSAFLVGSKFNAGEKGWRAQPHRDNRDPSWPHHG